MKNSALRLVVVVLILTIGYGGYRYYVNLHDPFAAGIPPHENADGTVDYTLIDLPEPGNKQHYWVFTLPKDQYVVIPDGNKIQTRGFGGAGSKVTFANRKNSFAILDFKNNDFSKYLKVGEDFPYDQRLNLSVSSTVMNHPNSAMGGVEAASMYCKHSVNVWNGITQYWNNAEERAQDKNAYCGDDERTDFYVVRNESHKIIGSVNCYKLDFKIQNRICHSEFYFPRLGREADISFVPAPFAEWKRIYIDAEDYLLKVSKQTPNKNINEVNGDIQ